MPSTEEQTPYFATAMLREIYEQPQALTAALQEYLSATGLPNESLKRISAVMRGHERLVIAASGSSRHAGLAGEVLLEDLAGVAVDVEYASEYAYRSTYTLRDPTVIAISQSGETADTLAALRIANNRNRKTLAITNAAASTMAREASASMPTMAGPEHAVPATKSFTTQLLALYLMAISLAMENGRMDPETARRWCAPALVLPPVLEQRIPGWDRTIAALATQYARAQTFLYLGRGIHYPIAREGALKMKESSYLHAEGYPAGELKHGPNALVSDRVPLVVIATRDPDDAGSMLRYDKTLQLLRDLREQGAPILALATDDDAEIASIATDTILVPRAPEYLLPIYEVIPLQLFAYHCARAHGVDVDRPRNLVKAVVEE